MCGRTCGRGGTGRLRTAWGSRSRRAWRRRGDGCGWGGRRRMWGGGGPSGPSWGGGGAGDGIDVTGQAIAVDVTDLLGAGLSASANNFIVDQGYAFAWTAAHTHAGDVTFTGAARTITSDGGYNLTIGAAGDLVLDPTGNITLPNAQEMRTVDFSDLVTG